MGRRGHFRTPRNPGDLPSAKRRNSPSDPTGSHFDQHLRGSVYEENALCELLEEEHFRGVALDVFETEPLPTDSPLWEQ